MGRPLDIGVRISLFYGGDLSGAESWGRCADPGQKVKVFASHLSHELMGL